MKLGLVIAIIGLLLVGAVVFLGLAVVAVAAFLWTRRRPAPEPFAPEPADEAATEVFQRGSMLAFYDADEQDRTEALRMEGGILIDGRTDPAIGRPGGGAPAAKKRKG